MLGLIKKYRDIWVAIAVVMLVCDLCKAQTEILCRATKTLSVSSLGAIMVLESGRSKPLDTYARNMLIQFSGRQRINGKTALEWIACVMFDPHVADQEAVFVINNPEVPDALAIEQRKGRRYSFADLYNARTKLNEQYQAAIQRSSAYWSSFEREIVRLHENFQVYGELSSTFSFLYPNENFLIADSSLATSVENPPPHCIVMEGNNGDAWVSPWGFIVKRQSAAFTDKRIISLVKMKKAYQKNEQEQFTAAVKDFIDENKNSSCATLQNPAPELFYNAVGPFSKAKIALGIAALFALMTLFSKARMIYWSSAGLIMAGWILTTLGILLRMIIMGHPPLSSLYEMFVCVAWVMIIIGMILELLRLSPIGLITSSITGFIFIHVAGKFGGDGDTMGVLIAVLNSSFWLTTHIITIALGYAGCVGAGVVGHIYLVQKVTQKPGRGTFEQVEKALYGLLSFGLLFTIVGTVLGGMWADQAWGSFWGWDPKENGALLIILWCLAVLHARAGGMIRNVGTAVGSITATVLVMCVWIGVNALGVGLHSYGFSSSGVYGLFIYCGVETAFLAAFGVLYKMQKKRIV